MDKIVQILYSGLGGHGSVVYSLLEEFKKENNDPNHFLIYYGIENLNGDYERLNAELNIPYHFIKKKQGIDIPSWYSLLKTLKKTQPKVVILHSITLIIPTLLYCKSQNVKLIAVEHNANQIKRLSEWLWSILANWFSYKTVYLTHNYQMEVKKKIAPFFFNHHASIIPNGINIDKFCPPTIEIQSSASGPITLFMHSRFTSFRDHPTLIHALKELSIRNKEIQLQLVLAGDGVTKVDMQLLAQELGLSAEVIFPGMLNEDEILQFLKKATIFTYASLAETMSTAIMQAMACGLPIVASDIPGINNMILSGENGMLVKPKSIIDLSLAIEKILVDLELRRKLSLKARNYAIAHLSNKQMFDSYQLLIKN